MASIKLTVGMRDRLVHRLLEHKFGKESAAAVFGKLGVFLTAAGGIVCGVGIVSFVWHIDGHPEYPLKYVTMAIATAFSLFFISIFIPDKNTVYAIAAAEVGQKITANPEVQGIASDASNALRVWINKQLEEPKKEK